MSRLWFSATLIVFNCVITSVKAADNLRMDGTLVAEPCSLDAKAADVSVDFKNIIDKALYANTRTPGQAFAIDLTDCDPSMGKKVSVIFKGQEDSVLPGLLAITGTAKGVAVGIETESGQPVEINKSTLEFPIDRPNLHLVFQGYVQGEPDALANHQIVVGAFSSIATFELDYP